MNKMNKILTLGLVLATLVPSSVGAASVKEQCTTYNTNRSVSINKVLKGEDIQKYIESILGGKIDSKIVISPKKSTTAPTVTEKKKNTTPATPNNTEKKESLTPVTPSKAEEKATPAPKAPSKPVEKTAPIPTTTSKTEEKKETTPKQNNNEQQQATSQNSQLNAFEQEVVNLTNQERAKNGLAPLKANVELSIVARTKSQDMINKNYFDHQSPTYGSPFDMMKNFGISYRTAGENIAKGQRTAQQVVNGWMNSEGHRKNILNANYTEIGVGYATSANGTPHWTQMFIG